VLDGSAPASARGELPTHLESDAFAASDTVTIATLFSVVAMRRQ
jgi:hypothetical protein